MFGRVLVFADFLKHYAAPDFVSAIDTNKITPAPTHYIGTDERIVDLVFYCPLKDGTGNLAAVIVFEHQSASLKDIPRKLHKYISAIWESEKKENKPLSAPYFIVLRTGRKPHRRAYPKMSDLLPKSKDGKSIGKSVEVEYDVVDLPSFDFDGLVGGAVLRSALMMLHKITGGTLDDDFSEALRPLLALSDEEQVTITKEMFDFADKAFKAHNRRMDESVISKALRIYKERESTMIKSIFDEHQDIGRADGIAKGKIETILAILRKRFNRVPKDVGRTIKQMTDPVALESWAVEAATCRTLDEFVSALK